MVVEVLSLELVVKLLVAVELLVVLAMLWCWRRRDRCNGGDGVAGFEGGGGGR